MARSSVLFTLSRSLQKQPKLREPSGGLASMPKLAYERKVCSMHKIISLSFIPGYGPIYRQGGGVKPKLDFLLQLKL
jgi:hypothetical protein